jgi:hypothetical protein
MNFYLRTTKPIWLVQAAGKIDIMGSWYVAEHRPAPAPGVGPVLLTFKEFAEQWKRNDYSLCVLLKEKALPRLTADIGITPKKITQIGEYVLVANRS